ncbi:sigma factor-like helix-turn-helix DNA-binding protein [Oceanirhabdus sp. W0125-5]|uniref:sigma factor-like helix-turn-helix DNA-binding protein n=1 Tax=Oceanirhabdus sp. W0125-5 TaxID=2999116 RepID=UPI0022F2DA31|nr:sigma factor-like helix-turn-helix DNA-binding protein [Oceanirhabdus sp. W0125-5]WBW97581.1 sigma factor-like helix-turn-helix DNA-binding protein [Oceanirhabdus sp. W0125-5]
MKVIEKIKDYRNLRAEIDRLKIELEELQDASLKAVQYREKLSPTNKITSAVEEQVIKTEKKISEIKCTIRCKERELRKIDNALTVLDEREVDVLKLKYIEGKSWETVCYKLDRSYSRAKQIERKALEKIGHLI